MRLRTAARAPYRAARLEPFRTARLAAFGTPGLGASRVVWLAVFRTARLGAFRTMRLGPFSMMVLGGALLLTGCAAAPTPRPTPDARGGEDVFRLSAKADRAYRESRWIEAARRYAELTERVPADAYAWFRLGNTHAQQGDYARAIRAYESSLERDAAQPKPWFNLSTAYLLHAQVAMGRARERLGPDDPARAMIDARLAGLNALVHGRIEDMPTRTIAR